MVMAPSHVCAGIEELSGEGIACLVIERSWLPDGEAIADGGADGAVCDLGGWRADGERRFGFERAIGLPMITERWRNRLRGGQ